MGGRTKSIALLFSVSLVLTGCVTTDGQPFNENRAVVDYMNLSVGYLEAGYTARAVKPLERALEIEPDSASVHGLLGVVFQRQGEDRLAEQSFNRALAIDSDASDIRNNFGAFLLSRNRLEEAYRQFELASQDVSYARRNRIFENMGRVALRLDKPSLAAENFTRALRLNSNLPRANLELAAIYKDEGDLHKAWQYYQAFDVASGQNARSLLLGIDLATANGAQSKVASYAMQLERLYPGSAELKQYRSRLGYE
ncbi:type IV pilus biogenesis/stability protein PilW [Endozoicomonas sp.]|uniref:type IV pilus biogenesis/stability protein PilW n=1 Tax=Endozoicomonas sp. TaxID=1892382 RepID=UPI002883CC3B|nr:type IV pilus biogenesis/stability protein PilW [Endozoicomonas sp.]